MADKEPVFEIEYPEKIIIPGTYDKTGYFSIKYDLFKYFNTEDKKSGVNWYFSYKKGFRKIVIFKEYTALTGKDRLRKFEIPTMRHLLCHYTDRQRKFLDLFKKAGITAEFPDANAV